MSLSYKLLSFFLPSVLSQLYAHFYLSPLHWGYLSVFFPFIPEQSRIGMGEINRNTGANLNLTFRYWMPAEIQL